MSNESDLHQIEIDIETAKFEIELQECYLRLKDNKDFKKLIEEVYFATYATNLVMLRADSNLPEDARERTLRSIDGIGQFKSFLIDIVRAGNQARAAIQRDEQERESILEEGI